MVYINIEDKLYSLDAVQENECYLNSYLLSK